MIVSILKQIKFSFLRTDSIAVNDETSKVQAPATLETTGLYRVPRKTLHIIQSFTSWLYAKDTKQLKQNACKQLLVCQK